MNINILYCAALLLSTAAAFNMRADSYSITINRPTVFLANHLDRGGNTLPEILPNLPDGSAVYPFDESTGYYGSAIFNMGGTWYDLDIGEESRLPFPPGRGIVLNLPGPFPYTIVFSGTVPNPAPPVALQPGVARLLSRRTYGPGTFESIVGLAPEQCQRVEMIRFDTAQQALVNYLFESGAWLPTAPVVEPGESVFIKVSAACDTQVQTRLTRVLPNAVGLCSRVILTAFGTGFSMDATMSLARQGHELTGTTLGVEQGGTVMSAAFDLSSASQFDLLRQSSESDFGLGRWDVRVRNGDNAQPLALEKAVVVRGVRPKQGDWDNDCQAAFLELQLLGEPVMLNNQSSVLTLFCRSRFNLGSDQIKARVRGLPRSIDMTIMAQGQSGSPFIHETDQGQEIEVTLSNLAADQSAYFSFTLLPHLAQVPLQFNLEASSIAAPSSTMSLQVDENRVPNGKTGPFGVGDSHYIAGSEPMAYQISFQNDASAEAENRILVRDQLDTSTLDISTFAFGPMVVAGRILQPPPGLLSFSQSYAFTENTSQTDDDIVINVDAKLVINPTSTTESFGLVQWDIRFTQGNLLPGQEGVVSLIVDPYANLRGGTVINNSSTHQIGAQDPVTSTWSNTIDNQKPISHVVHIAAPSNLMDVPLEWTGADDESGIASYSIYQNVLDGPYVEWLRLTTETSGIFHGGWGRSYSFYSTAIDRVGNVEDPPNTPDAIACMSGLTIRHIKGGVEVSWCAPGILQSKNDFAQDWVDMIDARSPLRLDASDAPRYFQLLQP